MIPERTGDAKSARKGAMTRLRNKQIGVLALAVASITALAACSSSGSSASSTNTPTLPGAVTQPGSIGQIPAAGTPSGKGVPGELGAVRARLLPQHDHQHVGAERHHGRGQHV